MKIIRKQGQCFLQKKTPYDREIYRSTNHSLPLKIFWVLPFSWKTNDFIIPNRWVVCPFQKPRFVYNVCKQGKCWQIAPKFRRWKYFDFGKQICTFNDLEREQGVQSKIWLITLNDQCQVHIGPKIITYSHIFNTNFEQVN